VVASVALGLFAMHRATRSGGWSRTRAVVALLLGVWLVLPAPVPGYEGHFAPAFLVFAFEALFQQAGSPRPAGIILAAGTALALALVLLLGITRRRR
jgi:hypothetical protein